MPLHLLLRFARCALIACAGALLGASAARASQVSVTLDGAQTYQLIDGFGVNANHRSWTNNELQPVLDALIDQAGMTLFRVVYDNADWETTNANPGPAITNWSYFSTVYSSPEFQALWGIMAYLNQKGITNGVMPNFQGFAPSWMGSAPPADWRLLKPGMEDEWAKMIASALVYARKTNHLQFTLVGPNNEPDYPGVGVGIANGQQYALTLHKLAQQLDANGLSDIRFVGPDRSNSGTNWLPDILNDPVVMAKLAHFGLHSYSDGGGWSDGVYDLIQQSAYPDRTFWMTEYNVWCDVCQNGIQGTNSWDYARGTAQYLLYHLANNASAGLVWDACDGIYRNTWNDDTFWSYWGLFAVNDTNAVPRTYTPRKQFYTLAQISKFVRPGARRISLTGANSPVLALAFYDPNTRQLTLAGINYDTGPTTLVATLNNLPGIASLDLYYTTSTANLAHGVSVPITNGIFSAVVPADSVFTLTGFVPAAITILTQPSNTVVRLGGTTTLNVAATGTAALSYQWQRNRVNIPGATNASLTLTNVRPTSSLVANAGTYRVMITSTAASLASSNAVLLVDRQNPVLSITTPKSGARLTNSVVSVSGTASDDTGIAAVFYQVNGSDWSPATGTRNWSANLNLLAGPNVFQAYALDDVGNPSRTNALAITFVVNSPLTLLTNGPGTLTPNFKGNLLEIGKTYTVTAVPGAGQVFSNWVGSVTSGGPVLSFVMQSNLVLQANFIPNPFLPAKGTYNGVFAEASRTHDHSGSFTLTLSSGGAYTARLQVGTTNYSAAGQFTVAGTSTQTILRRGTTSWTLNLALDLAGAQRLAGTVGDGHWLANLAANRVVFDAVTNPATQYRGQYNVMIPGGDNTGPSFPEGDGFAAASVGLSGKLSLGGSLADGTALSQVGPISGAGDFPVYLPLYSGKGSILGWLSLDTNQPASGLQGWLSWVKTAQRSAPFFPGGFTNVIMVAGSRYTPPAGLTNQVIPLTNALVSLEGGNLAAALTNWVVLSPVNQIIDVSLSNKLSLSLTVSNGLFQGALTPAGTTRRLSVQGAIFQDLGLGYGYFLGTNQSGRVYFGP